MIEESKKNYFQVCLNIAAHISLIIYNAQKLTNLCIIVIFFKISVRQ